MPPLDEEIPAQQLLKVTSSSARARRTVAPIRNASKNYPLSDLSANRYAPFALRSNHPIQPHHGIRLILGTEPHSTLRSFDSKKSDGCVADNGKSSPMPELTRAEGDCAVGSASHQISAGQLEGVPRAKNFKYLEDGFGSKSSLITPHKGFSVPPEHSGYSERIVLGRPPAASTAIQNLDPSASFLVRESYDSFSTSYTSLHHCVGSEKALTILSQTWKEDNVPLVYASGIVLSCVAFLRLVL